MTTADHLLLVFEDEAAHLALTPRAMAEHLDAQDRFAEGLRARGVLRDGGRLRPSAEGRRVRRDRAQTGGHPVVEEGPFRDEGPALAVFFRVRAATIDEAAALASACPALPSDVVEARAVRTGWLDDTLARCRGRVFGFAVLGRGPSPEAWNGLMDRIDAESSGGFPAGRFLGGVRLHAPSAGRRVPHVAPGRSILDGPFPEGREVIGGLFFLRLATLDDAVGWAAASHFVARGTLEVRELWRG